MLSWVHFGDLHASDEDGWRSLGDFDRMIDDVNANVAGLVDFAFLPGDNANHGTVEQYRRIRRSVERLRIPLHAIAGDHDFEPGNLANFHAGLGARSAPYSVHIGGRQCLFLDIVSSGKGGPDFLLGAAQRHWLQAQLEAAPQPCARPVVFMHAFPEDLAGDGEALARLFADREVACVDTGHTHYNEVLNDGATIYTATRSTGQIEEGPVGYSLHAVDGSAVSWRFKESTAAWPVVMITSPCDRRFVTDRTRHDQVPSANFVVRARIFGHDVTGARLLVDSSEAGAMTRVATEPGVWSAPIDGLTDGTHDVRVEAVNRSGTVGTDRIDVDVSSAGAHERDRVRRDLGKHSQSIGRWVERGLLGTQLGPNKNGRKW